MPRALFTWLYLRVPGDTPNPDYVSVRVNGVDVDTSMNVGYAHFAISESVEIQITARQRIEKFDLSPHRLGVAAQTIVRFRAFEALNRLRTGSHLRGTSQ